MERGGGKREIERGGRTERWREGEERDGERDREG